MAKAVFLNKGSLSFVLAALLMAGPAMAEPPPWAGSGKRYQGERYDQRAPDRRYQDQYRVPYQGGRFFVDRQRTAIHDFYYDRTRRGGCPPGLQRQRGGCVAPRRARPWVMGRPLPRNVRFYDLPPMLLTTIGSPPPGYRFVRVASDILLITIGTGIVMDAVADLGGRPW